MYPNNPTLLLFVVLPLELKLRLLILLPKPSNVPVKGVEAEPMGVKEEMVEASTLAPNA